MTCFVLKVLVDSPALDLFGGFAIKHSSYVMLNEIRLFCVVPTCGKCTVYLNWGLSKGTLAVLT
jgi:hypothetical protein